MTDAAFTPSAVTARKHAGSWQLFLVLLAAVTVLPFVLRGYMRRKFFFVFER